MSVFTSFSTEIDWFCRLLIAALCGGAIGYERATQRKSAGMRTHMVVAVAAALFMLVSKYGFFDILNLQELLLKSLLVFPLLVLVQF